MQSILLLVAVFGMKTCEICYEDKPTDKFATLKNCNHDVFCLKCMKRTLGANASRFTRKGCPKCRGNIVAVNNVPLWCFQWSRLSWINKMKFIFDLFVLSPLTALADFLLVFPVWVFLNNHQMLFNFVKWTLICYIIYALFYLLPVYLPEAFGQLNYVQDFTHLLQENDVLQHVEQFKYEITENYGTFGSAVVGPLFSSIFHACRNYPFLCTGNLWKTKDPDRYAAIQTYAMTKDESAFIYKKSGCTKLVDRDDGFNSCGIEINVYDLGTLPVFLRFENIDFILTDIGSSHWHYQPSETGPNYLEFKRTDGKTKDLLRIVYDVYEGVVDGRKSNLINFRKMTWVVLKNADPFRLNVLLSKGKHGTWDDFTNRVTLQSNRNFPLLQILLQNKNRRSIKNTDFYFAAKK